MVPKFCFNLIVQKFLCISCFIPELVESAELNPPSDKYVFIRFQDLHRRTVESGRVLLPWLYCARYACRLER